MDITAKHITSHIAYLDEEKYKETLWHHRPITDFRNVGHGIAKRLELTLFFEKISKYFYSSIYENPKRDSFFKKL